MSAEDQPDSDERLVAWLAEYADALGSGDGHLPDKSSLPTHLWLQLERALTGLHLLKHLRPEIGSSTLSQADSYSPTSGNEAFTKLPWSTLGRFQIRRELGRGSFGIVYLAFDPQLNREVALKVPKPEAAVTPELRQRFQREACAASALDHPNLVSVYEVGEVGPVCFIVSAYCPGITLAEWHRKRTEPVAFREAAQLTATLAEAVQHAHSRGILHRDLKPSNILLVSGEVGGGAVKTEWSSGGVLSGGASLGTTHHLPLTTHQPKIADFGLAKYLTLETLNAQGANASRSEDDATRTGAIMGTPSYMAPEQAGGKTKQIGPAVDLYALGAILYELLTGRPPFRGDSDWDTLLQLQAEEPVSPGRLRSRLPRDLETICLKCLEKEPSRRYVSASELAEDLHRYLKGKPILARPLSSAERLWRWCRRNPLPSGLAGVAVLLLMLVAVVATVGYVETKDALNREAWAAQDADTQQYDPEGILLSSASFAE